ncbi:ribonuclease R [Litoribacillus peritrichatus]|uniref:Ribonuclease R n=1 Tax=Litoribacillus peritrichatus TaxID=718191 RepID=A0ABP7MU21_9GAMM
MIASAKPAITATDKQQYSHPIPNRDYILDLLNHHKRAMTRHQLAQKMSLSGEEELEALRRRLRAMERDGQVSFDRRQGYRTIQESDLVCGRVIGHRDGFGFLARDEGGDDLLLNQHQMLKLFDGDRVQVRISGTDRRGREQASLVKVLEHNTTELVGQLCCEDDHFFILAHNQRIAHEIDVDHEQLAGAKPGQYVVVEITEYPSDKFNAFGKVTEVLGDADSPGLEIEVVMREKGIPTRWPQAAIDEAENLSSEVAEADKLQRVDLRHLPFVTIDGEDAKDFDDAVYCESKANGGWRLSVAIADVSHYVAPGSALDQEAHARGTSVYFPGRVVPMLPESLSNGLCSLNPHVDRLVLVCEMEINAAGRMTDYCFSEAVIHSHARLTYNQVNAFLFEQQPTDQAQYADLIPHLKTLHQLYGGLRKARTQRGSIDFDTQESQFQFDQHQKVTGIVPVVRNDAHKLIEECMLCANVATARFLLAVKLPALYRNHKGPQTKKLQTLRAYLAEKGLRLSGGGEPSPKDFDQLLASLGERSDADAIQTMLLRSLSQAEYGSENIGHFGLAYTSYAHFTSPIRRYPDLLVHRAIRSVIRRQESGGKIRRLLKAVSGMGKDPVQRLKNTRLIDQAESYPYDQEQMIIMGEHCSLLSRRADKASWDVEAWLKCDFMKNSIGDTFQGVVTTVTHFGLFIELDDTKVEGLIHISDMDNDYYQFDEAKQSLIGERSHRTYAIGDRIRINVARVDMEQKKIEFTLI